MSIKFHANKLTSAEASFLKWQYGFEDEDEPFERALWQAISRAWEADRTTVSDINRLERLGSQGAFPDEVALFLRFKSKDSDKIWNELIRRAGLSERRATKMDTAVERRKAQSSLGLH